MPWWTWLCLGLSLGFILLGAAAMLVALFRLFRQAKTATAALEPVAARLAAGTERLAQSSEAAAERSARVSESFARLQESKERLDILLWALGDVQRLLGALRFLTPVK